MKKGRKLILCVIVMILFSACSKTPKTMDESVLDGTSSNMIVYGADGYGDSYSVNEYGILYTKENRICYYDIELDEPYVLCDRANCSHSDELCSAWFKNPLDVAGIALYDDAIYLFRRDYDKNKYIFVSMDTTGNSEKKVAELKIGNVKNNAWVVSSVGDVYYTDNKAVAELDYTYVDQENEGDESQQFHQYIMIDLKTGQVNQINDISIEAGEYQIIGLSENTIVFRKTSSSEKKLTKSEFEAMDKTGEFQDIKGEAIEDRYFEYLYKWYPIHCKGEEAYVTVDLSDQQETVLEKNEIKMTFDDEGYQSGELPKYCFLGNYEGKFLVDEPDWESGSQRTFLWDMEENEKKELLQLEAGGTSAWETGSALSSVWDKSKFFYYRYLDETKAEVEIYDLATGETSKKFTDEKNITFRIVDDTKDFFIGKIYNSSGYTLYKIKKSDYLKGELGEKQKLNL